MKVKILSLAFALTMVLTTTLAPAADLQPQAVVQSATDRLLAQIQQHRSTYERDPSAFRAMVADVLVPAFDLDYTGRLVLARHWRSATEDQRQRFQDAFRHTLINSYASALLGYNESTSLLWRSSSMRADGKEAVVNLDILQPGSPPVAVGFAMRAQDAGAWRIYDVTIEAISLAMNFRGQFATEIERNGLDSLIARLETLSGANAVRR